MLNHTTGCRAGQPNKLSCRTATRSQTWPVCNNGIIWAATHTRTI